MQMGDKTGISWTDHTWNPFIGCTRVSAGCRICYFYRDAERYGFDPRVVHLSKTMRQPLKWKEPAPVFTCSWSDFFHNDIKPEWREAAWQIIRQTPHLTYQILTKRPENIRACLPKDWGQGWPNVWLGVTVETAKYIWRLDEVSKIPAVLRFASYEPALGPTINVPTEWASTIRWWIAGGESGAGFVQPKALWFQWMRDECAANKIPFFFKQWGGTRKIDGVWGGDKLDGIQYHEFPFLKNFVPDPLFVEEINARTQPV